MNPTAAVLLLQCMQVLFKAGDFGYICVSSSGKTCLCFPEDVHMSRKCIPTHITCEQLVDGGRESK